MKSFTSRQMIDRSATASLTFDSIMSRGKRRRGTAEFWGSSEQALENRGPSAEGARAQLPDAFPSFWIFRVPFSRFQLMFAFFDASLDDISVGVRTTGR